MLPSVPKDDIEYGGKVVECTFDGAFLLLAVWIELIV